LQQGKAPPLYPGVRVQNLKLKAVGPQKSGGHTVKKKPIPERWSQEYTSVSKLHTLPENPLHALKTAIEEIWTLEKERDRLLEDTTLLETSLTDLRTCRKDYMKLLNQKHSLEHALQQCRVTLEKQREKI
jgi:hypothetical protein